MTEKIIIDGKSVQFNKGQTILEIARENGIYIPSLCYHPKTGKASKCRICVVEVEGMRGLQTACSVDASEGMVVITENEKIIEARKLVVNMLLANGQHNCLACESNGECELQEAAYKLGIETPAFIVDEDDLPEVDDSGEMIVMDHRKCIQCGRCIEADNKTVVHEVLDFGYRAHKTKVICDNGLPMGKSSCVQCGECSQVCPVGAIIDKKSIGKGRPWELKKVDTICPYCGVGCKLTLHVDKRLNKIVKVTGVEGAPTNDGMLCVKGRYGYDFVGSDERLTTPMIREAKGGELKPVTWEEANSYIANKFLAIKKQHGSNAIAGLASAKVTNEENYAFQKFFRAVVGNHNVDHCARL
jgi:predicted molibdopterin-dependent oxidoreductase YjgC